MKLHSLKPEDIKRTLLNHTLQRPLVIYPVVLSVLAFAFGLTVEFSLYSWLFTGIGLGVGFGCWAISYFVNGKETAISAVDDYHKSIVKKRHGSMELLKEQLLKFEQEEGIYQIELLKNKFAAFQDVLDLKLNKSELTYMRYRSMAEQVFLSAIDNLNDAVSSLKSIAGINIELLNEQLLSLGNGSFDSGKREALIERKALFDSTNIRVGDLFIENERAMTELDRASNQLAKISTQSGHASMDIEQAMVELRTMAQRAEKYSR